MSLVDHQSRQTALLPEVLEPDQSSLGELLGPKENEGGRAARSPVAEADGILTEGIDGPNLVLNEPNNRGDDDSGPRYFPHRSKQDRDEVIAQALSAACGSDDEDVQIGEKELQSLKLEFLDTGDACSVRGSRYTPSSAGTRRRHGKGGATERIGTRLEKRKEKEKHVPRGFQPFHSLPD